MFLCEEGMLLIGVNDFPQRMGGFPVTGREYRADDQVHQVVVMIDPSAGVLRAIIVARPLKRCPVGADLRPRLPKKVRMMTFQVLGDLYSALENKVQDKHHSDTIIISVLQTGHEHLLGVEKNQRCSL